MGCSGKGELEQMIPLSATVTQYVLVVYCYFTETGESIRAICAW